jgi:hypothetical protein
MSSSTNSPSSIQDFDQLREDTVRIVLQRLIFISSAVFFFWFVFTMILHFTSFPVLQASREGQTAPAPSMLSVRIAAGFLITHFISMLFVQSFAAGRLVRARLISNTMFGALILAISVAISMAANLIPLDAIPYLKQAIAIAYSPPFVIANFLLCTLAGFFIYRYREVRMLCMIELYWSLGLMLLLGLAIGLLLAIAQS